MPTVTLRPNGTVTLDGGEGPSAWTVEGAASGHAALSDDSDSSDIFGQTSGVLGSSAVFDFTTSTIPTPSAIKSVTIRARAGWHANCPIRFQQRVGGVDGAAEDGAAADTPTNFTLTARTTNPSGGAWSQSDIDGFQVKVRITVAGAESNKIQELYADVVYNRAPSAPTITAPTGRVQRINPTVSWTFSDPDGDAQATYQVRILDGATPVYDSGTVASASTSVATAANLRGNYTYTAEVTVSDTGSGLTAQSTASFTTERGPGAIL